MEDDDELRLGVFGIDGGDDRRDGDDIGLPELLEEAVLARLGVEGPARRRSPSLLLDDGLL